MPNYLTKEEIRQWRGSLEKITLEEFAARLGKEVEESKPTNDVVDIVMSKGTSTNIKNTNHESFSKIAERAFERERQLSHTPFSVRKREMKVQKEEITESAPIETSEVVEDKAPVEAKPLTKGVVVHIGKYAAMVKTGKEEFVMKPEFVNCKVGDIVEF